MKRILLSVISIIFLSSSGFAATRYDIKERIVKPEFKTTIEAVPAELKKVWPEIYSPHIHAYSTLYFSNFKVGATPYVFSAFGGTGELCDPGPQGSMVTEDHPLRCVVRLLNTKTGDVKTVDNVCIEIHYGGDGSKLITKIAVDEEKKTVRIVNETKVFGGGACTNVFKLN